MLLTLLVPVRIRVPWGSTTQRSPCWCVLHHPTEGLELIAQFVGQGKVLGGTRLVARFGKCLGLSIYLMARSIGDEAQRCSKVQRGSCK